MKKIPTMFERDWTGDRSRAVDKQHPDCGWVFAGEGRATIKLDGMCAMIRGNALHKRRELKPGQIAPDGFELVGTDDETGKSVGWVPVGNGSEDVYFREAFSARETWANGTYELVGPKVQGGVENQLFSSGAHHLSAHGSLRPITNPPRTFEGLREWLSGRDIEGLVFHHPDGRMAKIKLRDFGLKRVGVL